MIISILPSGSLWQFNIAMENAPVETVSCPIKDGDFPLLCDSLPEGKIYNYGNPPFFSLPFFPSLLNLLLNHQVTMVFP